MKSMAFSGYGLKLCRSCHCDAQTLREGRPARRNHSVCPRQKVVLSVEGSPGACPATRLTRTRTARFLGSMSLRVVPFAVGSRPREVLACRGSALCWWPYSWAHMRCCSQSRRLSRPACIRKPNRSVEMLATELASVMTSLLAASLKRRQSCW